MTAQPDSTPKVSTGPLAVGAVLGAVLLWSYWTTLGAMVLRWWEDPQYSHGWLVPVFAVYVLWMRREQISLRTLNGSWLGLGLLGLAVALRLAGTRYAYFYFDQISLLPCAAGLILLVGGWPALRWSWPAVAFLGFMVPLPDVVSLSMSAPMQAFATATSTFTLQMIGRPAIAEGNVIHLNDIPLGIVEACSGLRMLVVFFALSTAVAMLIRKPLWEKLFVAGSAVPIALAANVLRITLTGLYYENVGTHLLGMDFHDVAGLLMMPIGLAFLGIELWILKTLLIERPNTLASQISLTRVAVSPVAMYQTSPTPRREKPAKVEKAPDVIDENAEPVAQQA